MGTNKYLRKTAAITAILMLAFSSTVTAQTSTSDALEAEGKGLLTPFMWNAKGVSFKPVMWGIDTAWLWDWWHVRTTSFMKDYAEIGRVTIDPRTSGSYTELSDEQKERLNSQLSWISGATSRNLKSLFLLGGISGGWNNNFSATFVQDLVMAAKYLQAKGYTVIAITPFNEPDYQGPWSVDPLNTVADNLQKKLSADPQLASIKIAGPSCLNNDNSSNWWSSAKSHFTMGNTHQLGGTAWSYQDFYQKVNNDGKPALADEMHTANDALMALEKGLDYGIWWSDHNASGYTQAEVGRAAKNGVRISYAQDNNTFTSTSIFRLKDNYAEAFVSSSERQGAAQAYTYFSQDRLVFWGGRGPAYTYTTGSVGGYSETVTEMSCGEDVPNTPLNGTFKLVNKASGKLLTANGSALTQSTDNGSSKQKWVVKELPATAGGDRAYCTVAVYGTSSYLDATSYASVNGTSAQTYAGNGNANEIWHFRYMGDGYYLLTNHLTGMSLQGNSRNKEGDDSNQTTVNLWERTESDHQLWRLIPGDGTYSTTLPAAPTAVTATSQSHSIRIEWNAVDDAYSYNIYRYNVTAGIWEVVGRNVKETAFIDNFTIPDTVYRYRIRALNGAWMKSLPSHEVTASVTPEAHDLVGYWPLTTNLADTTVNCLNGAGQGISHGQTAGLQSAIFGECSNISLPYYVGNLHSLTFSAWVYSTSDSDWQRIFDFGNGPDNYLFLTPDNGSVMRFEICKNGTKQGLNASKRLPLNSWNHIALTIGDEGVSLYLNGTLNASTTSISFRPDNLQPCLCWLGRSMFDSDPLFTGAMRNVALYARALTGTEVQRMYYTQIAQQLEEISNLANKPMNKDVLASFESALDALRNSLETESANLDTDIATFTAARDAANASIGAYEQAAAALQAEKDVLTSTNFYTDEARLAYGYDEAQAKYDDRTLTDREALALTNPANHSIGFHVANPTNTLLLKVWNGRHNYAANRLYINTWSTESEGKNATFQVPFFESWTNDGSSLEAAVWTATLTGLEPGKYKVSLQMRTRIKNDGGSKPQGITLNINDGRSYTVSSTNTYTADNGSWAIITENVSGVVADDGKLRFNIIVADNNNVSWLAFKKLQYRLITPTAIEAVTSDEPTATPHGTFNISGQRVDDNYKGIVIQNGKKTLRR